MTRRVQHQHTGAAGTVTATSDRFGAYDGDLTGPWSHVEFDDGLRCWVRDADLTDEGARP